LRNWEIDQGVPDMFVEAQEKPNTASQTILYMSTLARSKGILDLLRAVALLRGEFPGVRLRVAGNWSEPDSETEALALIVSENLGNCVEFVGNVDGADKRNFLLNGDIFCLPTRYPYEGQPLVLLEAMSAGLPVLATRHGAIGSTILDGITGRLIPRDAGVEALANALRELLRYPAQLREFGAAGRRRYLKKIHAGSMSQKIIRRLLRRAYWVPAVDMYPCLPLRIGKRFLKTRRAFRRQTSLAMKKTQS